MIFWITHCNHTFFYVYCDRKKNKEKAERGNSWQGAVFSWQGGDGKQKWEKRKAETPAISRKR
jgi:hypothetical protein